jgi:transcriptional regulator with XRE-family HTH domain
MQYERVRNLREDADLYQRDLAEYLHCTQVTYSRYELGMRDIPTEVWIALAEFYNTSVDFLLGLTDEKEPYPKGQRQSK